MRPVTRTIPALLGGVPAKLASEMGARGRMQMKFAVEIAAGSDLAQPVANDPTLSRFQFLNGSQVSRQQIFGEALDCGHILAEQVGQAGEGLALGIVDWLPWA